MSEADSMIARAKPALLGGDVEGVTCFRARPRADALAAVNKPLSMLVLAGLLWAMVVLRGQFSADPLDPFGLVLRILALLSSLRALVSIGRSVGTIRALQRAKSSAVAILNEGLVIRDGESFEAIARAELLGVHAGDAKSPPVLLLVPRPERQGEALRALPPGLVDPSERITEALEDLVPERAGGATPPPRTDAEGRYERAAAGDLEPGVARVLRGRGWLLRGPYGALIVAVALLERLVRLPAGMSIGPIGYGALALSIAIVLVFLLLGARRAREAKGLALVLTPEELLLRLPSGLTRVPLGAITGLELGARRSWSTLGGSEPVKTLFVVRDGGPGLTLSADELAAEVEPLASLIELYCAGAVAEAVSDDAS